MKADRTHYFLLNLAVAFVVIMGVVYMPFHPSDAGVKIVIGFEFIGFPVIGITSKLGLLPSVGMAIIGVFGSIAVAFFTAILVHGLGSFG